MDGNGADSPKKWTGEAMRKQAKLAMKAVELVNDGNRQEERNLSALLAPIDRRLNVLIFNEGFYEWEAAVGYNGQNNYTPGKRFRFGIDPRSLRPFVDYVLPASVEREEFCIDFAENAEVALHWLRLEVARRMWNYFHDYEDRVLEAVDPMTAYHARLQRISLIRAYYEQARRAA